MRFFFCASSKTGDDAPAALGKSGCPQRLKPVGRRRFIVGAEAPTPYKQSKAEANVADEVRRRVILVC
jgi:hypothetical protein